MSAEILCGNRSNVKFFAQEPNFSKKFSFFPKKSLQIKFFPINIGCLRIAGV
jgi:hypothetical protein